MDNRTDVTDRNPHDLVTHPHHLDPEHDPNVAALKTDFWVITAISNPARFKSRYALYRKFRHHVLHELRANLITVECTFADRSAQIVENGTKVVEYASVNGAQIVDVKVKNSSWVWLKEILWNVGLTVLPPTAKYVLFADADIQFLNRNVVTETIHALQTHKVVMPWETCADLGPTGQVTEVHRSFGWCFANGWDWKPRAVPANAKSRVAGAVYDYVCSVPPGAAGPKAFGNPWHPGFAIAFRRDVIDRLKMLEVGVLGAGDHHMCAALVGQAELSLPGNIHDNYRKQVMAWQALADQVVQGDFGFVPGTILHFFHGPKHARRYISRWKILIENDFDPEIHVYKNGYGVTELTEFAPRKLRDGIRAYFMQRNEDSPETE